MNSPLSSKTATDAELHTRIAELIGEDIRFIAEFRVVAPKTIEHCQAIFKHTTTKILPFGQGTTCKFPITEPNAIGLSTILFNKAELFPSHQTISVGAGCAVNEVNDLLTQNGFSVPALTRFQGGSIGGRLAMVSSSPSLTNGNGWIQSLLGLTVLLPSGEIIQAGGHCIKDVAGYDVRHLFTGSRGAFGLIVNAVFRMVPLSPIPDLSSFDINVNNFAPISERWQKLFDPTHRMVMGIGR